MANRINRAIELCRRTRRSITRSPHSGHVLTYAQGREDAGTWADYMNVGMEHGSFDMTGLADYMRGMVDAGSTRSGHRTPAVIVEAPVNGTDEAHCAFDSWQFRQTLGRGVHGILFCQAETLDAVRRLRGGLPRSAPSRRRRPGHSLARVARLDGAGALRRPRPAGKLLLGIGMRGRGSE